MNEDEKQTTNTSEGETVPTEQQPTPAEKENNQASQNGKSGKPLADLKQRLMTAGLLAILYVGGIALGIYVSPYFYDALIVFFMLMAATEFSRAISNKFAKTINGFVYATIVLGYAAFSVVHNLHGSGGVTSFFGVLALVFIACIVYNMFSKNHTINNVISTLFVMIYPVTIMIYLVALNYLALREYSSIAIILAFGVTTLVDSMAYFVGSLVRGPKLCPKISPKKTISGAIGGLIGGIGGGLIAMVFANFGLFNCAPISSVPALNVMHFIFLGLGTALFCQIGDLISSYIKRACQIKDFGTLLKGHGGFMDRMDGVMMSAVFIFIYFTILGIL